MSCWAHEAAAVYSEETKMKDKYSVGEIAKIFQISKQAIRYYDALGLISPTEVDAGNKYRYYSYNQFMDFALIKLLKDTGIKLDVIKEYLHQKNIRQLELILNEQICEYYRQIEDTKKLIALTQSMYNKIHRTRDNMDSGSFQLLTFPARYFKCIQQPFSPDDIYVHIKLIYDKIVAEGREQNIFLNTQMILSMSREAMLARDFSRYGLIGFQIQADEVIPGQEDIMEFPAGTYVKGIHFGSYQTIGNTYGKMVDMIRDNRMEIIGNSFEISCVDIKHTNNPEEFITEIQIPVRQANDTLRKAGIT